MGVRISRHAVLLFVSLIYLVPPYLIIVNSFKTTDQFLPGPLDLPLGNLTMDNYAGALMILFIALQRYVIGGLTHGAVRG